jgi:hypothetical protein
VTKGKRQWIDFLVAQRVAWFWRHTYLSGISMKHSLKSAIAVAALGLCATTSFAQTSNFSGFSAGINLNMVGASTEISNGANKLSLGENSATVAVQGSYAFNLGGGGVMGVGAAYNAGELAAGKISAGANLYTLRVKNLYSIFIEPGFATGNSLFYGKLAYLNGKGEESLNANSGSDTFTGAGYGVGMRSMMDSKMYLQVEILQTTFSEKTFGTSVYKPSATMATFGIGVKF